ncbi:MAG: tetratricopeptide repeat protein [Pseudomonadota bacterium]
MPVLRICLLLVLASILPAPAAASDAEICSFSTNWTEREAACARLIDSGQISGDNLSRALTNRCKARVRDGRYGPALQDCNEAIALEDTNWQAYDVRAAIHLALGQQTAALGDLDQADRLNRDWAPRSRARADVLCSLKRADEAMAQYRRSIERNAFDPVGWQTFLADQGFYRGAIDGVFGTGSMSALENWVLATCR